MPLRIEDHAIIGDTLEPETELTTATGRERVVDLMPPPNGHDPSLADDPAWVRFKMRTPPGGRATFPRPSSMSASSIPRTTWPSAARRTSASDSPARYSQPFHLKNRKGATAEVSISTSAHG